MKFKLKTLLTFSAVALVGLGVTQSNFAEESRPLVLENAVESTIILSKEGNTEYRLAPYPNITSEDATADLEKQLREVYATRLNEVATMAIDWLKNHHQDALLPEGFNVDINTLPAKGEIPVLKPEEIELSKEMPGFKDDGTLEGTIPLVKSVTNGEFNQFFNQYVGLGKSAPYSLYIGTATVLNPLELFKKDNTVDLSRPKLYTSILKPVTRNINYVHKQTGKYMALPVSERVFMISAYAGEIIVIKGSITQRFVDDKGNEIAPQRTTGTVPKNSTVVLEHPNTLTVNDEIYYFSSQNVADPSMVSDKDVTITYVYKKRTDAPKWENPIVELTRYVDEEGTEIKESEMGLHNPAIIEGYTYKSTTEENHVRTHIYKKNKESESQPPKPSEEEKPQPKSPELPKTGTKDMEMVNMGLVLITSAIGAVLLKQQQKNSTGIMIKEKTE